jgi:hypothetical protein
MSPTDAIPFDEAMLLSAWERTLAVARPWREVALLAAANGEPAERLARLPVGERDRRLLDLREHAFGSRLECETACPACGARLELELTAAEIRSPTRDVQPSDLRIADDGTVVTFRLPDSADVAASRGSLRDPEEFLLSRCVVEATHQGAAVDGAALPLPVRDRVAARMAELDPHAELLLLLTCPDCAHSWQAVFDPAAFLLAEVDAWAARLLSEVHRLARAYGWSEAEILALSPLRRRRYLELAQA